MIMTPRKPIPTAVQRRHPTGSPRIGTASAVRKSGPARVIATASAKGMKVMPVTKSIVDKSCKPPRRP
jgi:hypothetical protein